MHECYTRYSAEEKETIVLTVKRSELSISEALKRLGIPRRTFYNWYKKYAIGGLNALRATHTEHRQRGTAYLIIFDK